MKNTQSQKTTVMCIMHQSPQQNSRITNNAKEDMDQSTCITEFFAVAMRDRRLTIAGDDIISLILAALDWLTTYNPWPSTYVSVMSSTAHVTSTIGITTANAGNDMPLNVGRMAWCPRIDDTDLGTLSESYHSQQIQGCKWWQQADLCPPTFLCSRPSDVPFHGLLGFHRWSSSSWAAWRAACHIWRILAGTMCTSLLPFLHIDFIWENV
jgi:hypothetical protein